MHDVRMTLCAKARKSHRAPVQHPDTQSGFTQKRMHQNPASNKNPRPRIFAGGGENKEV